MKRFRELVGDIRKKYPADDFLADFEESCREPLKRTHFQSYDSALMTLDDDSWGMLKAKALAHYLDERKGQRKQGFYNQLNEAFAYRYLWRKGFANVRILKEDKKRKTPDIRFLDRGSERYCEVKTIGITDKEIKRREREPDRAVADYSRLPAEFLRKLDWSVHQAKVQLQSVGTNGFVFILIRFDDMVLDYYRIYRRQIVRFCLSRGFESLIIKVGHWGNRRIFVKNQQVALTPK